MLQYILLLSPPYQCNPSQKILDMHVTHALCRSIESLPLKQDITLVILLFLSRSRVDIRRDLFILFNIVLRYAIDLNKLFPLIF